MLKSKRSGGTAAAAMPKGFWTWITSISMLYRLFWHICCQTLKVACRTVMHFPGQQ